jgi:hypothetical protein
MAGLPARPGERDARVGATAEPGGERRLRHDRPDPVADDGQQVVAGAVAKGCR